MLKVKVLVVALLSACYPCLAQEKSNFTLSTGQGPHAVGFRVVHKQGAIANYQTSLSLNEHNQHAAARLKALEAGNKN